MRRSSWQKLRCVRTPAALAALGPPAVDGGGQLTDFGDVGVRAAGQELPACVADAVAVGAGAGAGQGEAVAQGHFGDPCGQQDAGDLCLWRAAGSTWSRTAGC